MQLAPRRPSARRLLAAALLIAGAPFAAAQQIAFSARLDGASVVPPATTAAGGVASLLLDLGANTLSFDLTHVGLGATEVSASIHGYAPAGANAPALFSLPLGFKKTGTWSYPQADEAMLLASLAYLQIATTSFPAGELRGQVVRDSSPVAMNASLDGAQETPPNGSLAKGTAHCSIDTGANTLEFAIAFEGVNSAQTAAHIHGPATFGQIAPPVFALPINAGSVLVATWTYMESQEADILAGLMYFNVHSTAFSNGEIRGQILALDTNPSSYCTAKTTSLGCTPALGSSGIPSASAGSGFVLTCGPVPGASLGVLFYGTSGPLANPFQGGFLCVQPPTVRTAPQSSGGTFGVCDGAYSLDFNAHVASGSDPALVAGALVNVQTWFRDPGDPVAGTGLSDALMLELRP